MKRPVIEVRVNSQLIGVKHSWKSASKMAADYVKKYMVGRYASIGPINKTEITRGSSEYKYTSRREYTWFVETGAKFICSETWVNPHIGVNHP